MATVAVNLREDLSAPFQNSKLEGAIGARGSELIFFLGEFAARQAVGVALLVVGDVARVGVGFEEVLPGVDEEAAGSGGRVADALAWARITHVDHHADDVVASKIPIL